MESERKSQKLFSLGKKNTPRQYRVNSSLEQSYYIISIFHECMVRIEKSVTRVTDRHYEACRVVPNSDPE